MKKTVFAYIHTHWDREWYRDFESFRVRLVEIVDDILLKLETRELDTFYFDGQTSALEDYLQIKPDKQDLIKKFIKDKRLYVGPYFCSTDSFLVDSESVIRNLQLGLHYSKSFGCSDFIAYHADTFGHSSHLPHIIKYFGLNNAIFWRGLGELDSEFVFNGLNSTYLIEGYFHDYFSSNLSTEKKVECLKRTLDRIAKYSGDSILLPIGADHLCSPDDIKNQILEINDLLDDYCLVVSTPFDYFKKVANRYNKPVTEELRDTKRNFILPGVYSSRVDLKQLNSRLQWDLSRICQPFQAVMSYLKKAPVYQNQIDYAYKVLLKNQAHDSIYGCSIDAVHKENKLRYQKVGSVVDTILNSIKAKMYHDNDTNLSLFNLSNFALNGSVRVSTSENLDKKYNAQLIAKTQDFPITKVYPTNKIPVTEDYTTIYEYLIDVKNIDSFSITSITDEHIVDNSSLKISEKSIENNFLKLELKNKMLILSDKISGKKYNNFINFIDRADIGDSYNFGALKNDKLLKAVPVKSKILESGHIRSILEIEFEILLPKTSDKKARSSTLMKHKLKLQAVLENQNEYIEFRLNWDNKSTNHILQLELNLNEPVCNTISDDLVGCVERTFDCEYDVSKLVPAPRGVELKHNTAPMQKYVIAQGVGLITEGLQEYEVYKNKLRLTLLRATGVISNPHNPTRGTPAGPPIPTPDLQMLGKNVVRFALCFKDNQNSILPCVEHFYSSSIVCQGDVSDIRFLNFKSDGIFVNTIKTDSQGNLLFRFVNKSDEKRLLDFSTDLKFSDIRFANEMELVGKRFEPFEMKPHSFVNVLIMR